MKPKPVRWTLTAIAVLTAGACVLLPDFAPAAEQDAAAPVAEDNLLAMNVAGAAWVPLFASLNPMERAAQRARERTGTRIIQKLQATARQRQIAAERGRRFQAQREAEIKQEVAKTTRTYQSKAKKQTSVARKKKADAASLQVKAQKLVAEVKVAEKKAAAEPKAVKKVASVKKKAVAAEKKAEVAVKEAAAAEKKAEVAQAEVKKAAVNVEKQVKKKKSRFVAVPTEKDERSKGAKNIMIWDTETREVVGNTVYDVSAPPKVGAVTRFDTYTAEYVGAL